MTCPESNFSQNSNNPSKMFNSVNAYDMSREGCLCMYCSLNKIKFVLFSNR